MALDTTARTIAADAVAAVVAKIALHTGDPGSGAANELSGGGYVRQAAAWDPASGGIAELTDALEYDVPAVTITWVTAWDASGSTRYGKAQLASPAPFPTAGVFRLLAASVDFTS